MKKKFFTGERMVPEENDRQQLFYEHLNRYKFASTLVKEKEVLDLACGVGYGCEILKDAGAKSVTGLDLSKDAIDYAKRKYSQPGVKFVRGDAIASDLQSNKFDVVSCFEFIEHIDEQDKALKEIKRILKDNGILFISTPNKLTYHEDNKFHKKELNFKQFKMLLKKYFKNIQIYGQFFWFGNFIMNENKSTIFKSQLPTVNLEKSQYFIAVCSNHKIAPPTSSLIATENVDNLDISIGLQPLVKKVSDLVESENELLRIKSSRFFKVWRVYSGIKNVFIKDRQ